MSDVLGDRMKLYELAEAGRRFMPLLPILARIDGRCFSAFTRGMERPYDQMMTRLMVATTRHLVEETNASMGYTQSDEITLAWHQTDMKSQVWFDGRISKMTSQLGAQATLFFYRNCCEHMPAFASRHPTFDARVWQVPRRTAPRSTRCCSPRASTGTTTRPSSNAEHTFSAGRCGPHSPPKNSTPYRQSITHAKTRIYSPNARGCCDWTCRHSRP
jgi:hypothetical protein